MYRLCIQFLLITQLLSVSLCDSQYTIIAPGVIRPNRKYSVAVNLHDAPAPATIRVSITSSSKTLNLSQEVTLQPKTSKLIDFKPSNLLSDYMYELEAEGIKGIAFKKTYPLNLVDDGGPLVLVESDRAIYKPEDVVQFRVIILDEHLRPIDIVEPMRVQILDAAKNRVKQFKDIKLKRGVFAAKFPLSKQPILGNWTITTYISGKYNQLDEYHFQVEKYVLPKFSVHIETDRNFPKHDRFLKATVYGKYTFGKFVEGTVEVTLLDALDRENSATAPQIVQIEKGIVKAEVVLDTQLLEYVDKIYVFATLTEKLTNVTASGEALVNIQSNRHNFLVPETGIEFRDKQPFRMKIQVEHWNGTRVRDVSTPITMSLGDRKYKTHLNNEGIAQFEFQYDPEASFWIGYGDDSFYYDNIFTQHQYDKKACVLCTIQMSRISSMLATAPIDIKVSAENVIPYIFYTITSRGNIIRGDYVQVPDMQTSHTITLNVSIDMIPQSYFYAHYIADDVLHTCEFTIRLPEKFENEISIAAPTSVKPGQQITLNVNGQPNSHVSIVAVDKSSLLLSSDNLMSKSKIMNDLRSVRTYVALQTDFCYPSVISGLITLSNATIPASHNTRDLLSNPCDKNEGGEGDCPPEEDTVDDPRSIFPETWIFEDMEIDKAVTPLNVKLPDTITTWIVRAFSINDHSGFGMMESSVNILSIQPFFISTNLPYSVKRGEIVTIPITIFNYLEHNYPTEVTMDNSKAEFKFVDSQNRPLERTKDSRHVDVPANNGKSVAFVIIAKKVGDIDIRITAKNSNMTDSILQKLKVEPEGIKQQYNSESVLTLIQGDNRKSNFEATIPEEIVPESEYLTLSVSGDVLVSTLENLEKLVMLPTGCGEQNMVNLAPNILVLDYLRATGRDTNATELVDRAKRFIDVGYQQELTYRHAEGGYSVFGPESNSKASNWLTAYVSRFFIKGMKYSAVEPKIIKSDLEFLAKQQADNGSFLQRGYVFEPAHQNQYGFTAFVLLTFLEDEKYSKKYSKIIDKAMNFLDTNLNSINDIYSLAIMANVFRKTGNSHANDIMSKLKSQAQEDNGLMWWTNDEAKNNTANDVEITAYTLMALLETPGNYAPIFHWLLQQRNSHGGFGSTQDTVVGLQALIQYTAKYSRSGSQDTQLKVHYMAKDATGKNVKEHILGCDEDNKLILQMQELPSATRSVEVDVVGQGKLFLQFAYQYYMPTHKRQIRAVLGGTTNFVSRDSNNVSSVPIQTAPRLLSAIDEHTFFLITATTKFSQPSQSMSLAVCHLYQPLTLEDKSTNMVILQIHLPSGFVSNNANVAKLREEEEISRVEVKSSSTMLAIYFEKLEADDEQCLTVVADRIHEVQSLKSAIIEMYDFYNPARRSEILYDIKM